MRKPVIVLACTTAAFAASTIYLLVERRAPGTAPPASAGLAGSAAAAEVPADASTAAAAASTSTSDVRLAAAPRAAPGVAGSPGAATPPAGSGVVTDHTQVERQRGTEFARRELRALEDPVQREKRWRDARKYMSNGYPGLAQRLGLDPQRYEQLLDLLTTQQLADRESRARCTLDPACNRASARQISEQQQRAELDGLMGADRQQRLADYMTALPERNELARLQSRVALAPLSPAQFEQLATALAADRLAAQAGQPPPDPMVNFFHPSFGAALIPRGDVERGLAVAREYNRRLHDRAATILNSQQLAAYDRMREDALVRLQRSLERQARESRPVNP